MQRGNNKQFFEWWLTSHLRNGGSGAQVPMCMLAILFYLLVVVFADRDHCFTIV